MKTILTISTLLVLTACGGQSTQDKQIAENAKKIEILKQEAEIKRLQSETAQNNQVYQLAASEVANTIPQNLQDQAKTSGQPITGTDGQQYMYDKDSGNWLLYGAIGAAAGYLMANAMNNRQAAKYQPVTKPTAAVQRVYKDYTVKNPNQITPPRARTNAVQNNDKPFVSAATPQNQPNQAAGKPATPNYRPVNPDNNRSSRFGGGRRRR